MTELKHGFGAAKMNKDADERTVPNGEYRDALNVQIVTSDGSNVGTLQTLLGNKDIVNPQITASISSNAKCVGSIADEANNKIYYFISDPDNFTDYIFQYNSNINTLLPVVVDKYQVDTSIITTTSYTAGNVITYFIIDDLHSPPLGPSPNITNVRPGMTVAGNFYKITLTNMGPTSQPFFTSHNDGLIVIKMEEYIDPTNSTITGWKVYLDETIIDHGIFSGGLSSSLGPVSFRANRTLNFEDHQITGINIIDGVIYWTDGTSEPKKIIVENLLNGTDVSGKIHSKFNVYDKYGVLLQDNYNAIDFRDQPENLKEEHITVIKKSPLHPPAILMSNTSDNRLNASGISNLESIIQNELFTDIEGSNLPVGTIKNVTFDVSVDYVKGDIILLRKDAWDVDKDYNRYEIIVELLEFNPNTLNATVKIIFIQSSTVNDIITTSNADIPSPNDFHSMLKQEKPLYEFKLPRFAYRYKYQDNQYSTYSPFSEPAFLPGEFIYNPKEGYNLGMVNTLRSVYVMDFVTDEDVIPKDVVEIDILYKESNSTNIYTVKTIKYSDSEWTDQGSVLNTLAWNGARTTGRIHITSEMVRAAVASNQLLRPWDNVPRTAKAQDIVGNRIVYANYLQNYNL